MSLHIYLVSLIALSSVAANTASNPGYPQSNVRSASSGLGSGSNFGNHYQRSVQGNGSCASPSGEESHQTGRGNASAWPWQIYKSAPYNPPELEITTNGLSLAQGLVLISPSDTSSENISRENAPLIMTDAGQLVWNGPKIIANNFQVASYKGNDVLTYWSGTSSTAANIGHGYGNVTILDASYSEVLVVCPQFGLLTPDDTVYQCEGDFHESSLTDRDTIFFTAYNVTQTDLSFVGGPKNGWVYDCLFFELDPSSGKILFQWSALEHVPVSDTKQPLAATGVEKAVPFDWFHINSVINVGNNYLVNSRHLWSTYLVTAAGDISWTLQGETGGDFGPLPTNGQFAWQHFARPHNVSNTSMSVSYFNNYNSAVDNGSHPTILLELSLSLPPNPSTPPTVLEHRSDIHRPIYAESQGSHLFLPNGNAFGGYGQIPLLREFGPNDLLSGTDLRWSARFGPDNLVQSYRAFKSGWHAIPKTVPSLVVEFNENGCSTGYVSWNGATDVSAWIRFEGSTKDSLSETGRVKFKGFETKFAVTQACMQVAAVVNGSSTLSNVVCAESAHM